MNGNCVFTYTDAPKQVHLLHKQGVLELSLTFAPENELPLKNVSEATNEYGFFSHNTIWDEDNALVKIRSTTTTKETE